ncbi:MAG: UDP-N-acetylmuramoyl-tripeptide--D-alanyl-D-alanine ligase, partial [Acidimicrobiales bacterium]|nr:UDP-N-acetylmuramoyl-tripeptide--D-alanyl-D-alanine ligase [Acidimicrobiales bacterium]
MHFRASEIAAVVGGELVGDDVEVSGASQDSRSLIPGQLFVPVLAERDGHDFIRQAIEAGAAAYFTQAEPVGGTAIRVTDAVAALQALGRHARSKLGDATVIGITGSAGKTSTKDLMASILLSTGNAHASEKSFNNEMGVPLTIINAPDNTAVLIVEMGTRGAGQIRDLVQIAAPSIGVVTTVGGAHTSEFGSVEAVAEAKAEMVEDLPAMGWAVLNAEVPLVAAMAEQTSAQVVTFGRDTGDVHATDIVRHADLTSEFTLVSPWGSASVHLGARGEHNIVNACAAAAAALAAGAGMSSVVLGLVHPELSPLRMELLTTPAGATVLNDCYNANPLSVEAALRALADLPAERRVAVLGLMAELGDEHEAEHARMAELAETLEIRVLAVAGAPYAGA